jgi:integrase
MPRKRSLEAIQIHVRLLLPHVGHLEPRQVLDATLASFIAERLSAGVAATTINRSLEVVRTILYGAARSYRDDDGRPWLDALPPLLTMLPESRRQPYPITWQEQDRLFPMLPDHLQRMVLFAVNTGLRDNNVCGLAWEWEVFVPEIERSVFVVPNYAFKSRRPHVVILNDAAWSIIQAQRGRHPIWVFPYRGQRIGTMNNNGWQQAHKPAEKPGCNGCASMTCATPTPAACVRQASQRRIAQRCWATSITRWLVTMRVRTSAAW